MHLSDGGNHRGSVFRRHVGAALIRRGDFPADLLELWNEDAPDARETPVELAVSRYIGALPFLWLDVDDEPSRDSLRSVIEREAVGLLSSAGADADPPSWSWLGHFADREEIRASGLWNVNYVGRTFDPGFLDHLERLVEQQPSL